VAFGSAVAVAVIGGICAAVFPGLTGQLLALVLISVGLGAVVLLVFYEVGLSEDKERAAEQERRAKEETERTDARPHPQPHPRPRLRPRRPRRLRE
jgi:NADH:ubiquinone oxidoreductase subunit 6 (subunit J)